MSQLELTLLNQIEKDRALLITLEKARTTVLKISGDIGLFGSQIERTRVYSVFQWQGDASKRFSADANKAAKATKKQATQCKALAGTIQQSKAQVQTRLDINQRALTAERTRIAQDAERKRLEAQRQKGRAS